MLKLYGRKTSINVQKVLWTLDELGLDFEHIDAEGTPGSINTQEYRELHPMAMVPTLDDDGFILWQSNAIVRYLLEKHGGDIYPTDPQQQALANQWIDWMSMEVWDTLKIVFLGLLRTPPEQRNMDAINGAMEKGGTLFQILDRHLADRNYILGDAFSVADIPMTIAYYRYVSLVEERPDMPHVNAWYERMQQRDAFQSRINMPLA